ncbi:hypothetical protein [Nocardia aurantia]|uniref:Uncharacterized protein n=1 Tax=Nocardia aurantia TaxID=2585199 RepID=A0A7K0DLB1_9NOCA|nr:hypothetical protein [Nocardia aurantia]MQY26573.1 hypothetical protein [Nocardia aurantia]
MHRFAGWWDGFELWVAGLPFIPQFAVVLVGMIPVSFAIAYLLDRGLRIALRLLGRDRPAAAQTPVTRATPSAGRSAVARTVGARRRRQPARGGDGPGAGTPRHPGGPRPRRRRAAEEAV